jgi:uncharacterized membrane protein YfcA
MIEFTLILIGLFSGLLMGMIGIGGGVIMLSLMVLSGISLKHAVAITLVLQMVPQSIFGVYEYWKNGFVNWWFSLFIIIGSTIGIYGGSLLSTQNIISTPNLYLILSISLIIAGIYFGINRFSFK